MVKMKNQLTEYCFKQDLACFKHILDCELMTSTSRQNTDEKRPQISSKRGRIQRERENNSERQRERKERNMIRREKEREREKEKEGEREREREIIIKRKKNTNWYTRKK